MSNGTDKRASRALNMYYGNRSFLASMRGLWIDAEVIHAYMYGHGLQVLYSAIGLVDIYRLFSRLPYPVEVAVDSISISPLKTLKWKGVLEEWCGVSVEDCRAQGANSSDVLILVDVHENSSKKVTDRAVVLLENAIRQNMKVVVINEPGKNLPVSIGKFIGKYSGSSNHLQNPFMSLVVDACIGSQFRNRIFVYGESLRTVTTAMGATDHLTRRQGGKSQYYSLAKHVVVDSESPVLQTSVVNYSDVLGQLGIAYVEQAVVELPLDREGPNLQPLVRG